MAAQSGIGASSSRLHRRQRTWAFLQRELLIVCWTLTDLALIAPFALAMMPWARFWPQTAVMFWLLLMMLFAFNLARAMTLLQFRKEIQRNIMVASLMLTLVLMLPMLLYRPESATDLSWLSSFAANFAEGGNSFWRRDLTIFLLTVLIWWRGIRLSHQTFTVSRAGLRLRLGGLIGGPLVVWATGRGDIAATPYILLFFFSAIMAVALVRAEQLEQDKSGHSASLSPRWLSGIVVAGLAVILFAGLMAVLISGESARVIVGWLSPLWGALAYAAAAILNVIGYLAQPLFLLLTVLMEWLSNLLRTLLATAFSEPLTLPVLEIPIPQTAAEALEQGEPFIDGGPAIVLLLMVALILVTGLSLSRLYRHPTPADFDTELLSKPVGRLLERDTSLIQRILRRIGVLQRGRAAASVRRIYQEMSDAAEASGFPRALHETPYEYVETLGNVWPDGSEDIWQITQAYIKIRYGEIPETQEELDEITAAWIRLKHTRPVSLIQDGVYAELE